MQHIVIFDSGIGGTSVLAHIQSAFPNAQYSYLMDNLYLPYGKLDSKILHNRLLSKLKTVETYFNPIDLIVVACNTASTQSLALLRKHTNIPIVGVVPAIKPAANKTQTQKIGLLATPATIKNSYIKNLINDHATNIDVHLYASVNLVALAEEKFWTGGLDENEFKLEIERLSISKKIDCLVLGCTHFPILSDELNKALGSGVELIDSGNAIANRVSDLLTADKSMFGIRKIKRPIRYYATAPVKSSIVNVELIKLIDL
ncbi:glutamate racemase [Pseudoalteromonas denitrificans]|uniref:Glutamate racemase n=1 Tax=Pseudoalteromonas denitrificans DSM 6059 TaxID=1123010 RepID=A0A1I1TYZ7_9GAMM|nr:glutamate racemase [Pseudoalteromonas denitrificans]SFD63787.1 glutamate racemase [Pseudoalteromonas denitrificans DSM 6059]